MLQVLDWLVLLRNCDVQILWTLQGVEWFDVVHVVPRFTDPRVQSNNKNSSKSPRVGFNFTVYLPRKGLCVL